jgi:hypothetical protein
VQVESAENASAEAATKSVEAQALREQV